MNGFLLVVDKLAMLVEGTLGGLLRTVDRVTETAFGVVDRLFIVDILVDESPTVDDFSLSVTPGVFEDIPGVISF